VRWNETEKAMQPDASCGANPYRAYRCEDMKNDSRTQGRDELLASARTYLLVWSITLLLMLEDDVAMIALMFC
jgi:hypothetical protein